MYKKKVVVKSKTGLHARPGTEVVECAVKFDSVINIEFNDKVIDAKEVLDIISSDINCGDEIIINANGADEEKAVNELVKLIETMDE